MMFASRNIRLCTKDCICLFVCPTGATDTESGQIDASKCLTGAACALMFLRAIHLVPRSTPNRNRNTKMVRTLFALSESKVKTRQLANALVTITALPERLSISHWKCWSRIVFVKAGICCRKAKLKRFLKISRERIGTIRASRRGGRASARSAIERLDRQGALRHQREWFALRPIP